jgi:hypothetical protein
MNARREFYNLLEGTVVERPYPIFGDITEERMLQAIENSKDRGSGHLIKQGTKEARSSRKVLEAFIEHLHCGWPICMMTEDIQLDKEMAKLVMKNDPTDICYLRPEMIDNFEVMEEIVNHERCGNSIRYSTARVKNDKRIALIGLHYRKGEKVCFSSFGDQIRDDDTFFLIAYLNDDYNFRYASERLRRKYWFLKTYKIN